jgi:hypothetical protein
MITPQQAVTQKLRIGVEDVNTRQQRGEAIAILDARNDQAWESSPVKIRGAIRIPSANWHTDPSWPKDRFTVVY